VVDEEEQEQEQEEKGEDESGRGDGERSRGISWRDPAGGDHWRAGDGGEGTRKRRRERGEDAAEGKVSRPRRERDGGR
jgi:hypothetical protein